MKPEAPAKPRRCLQWFVSPRWFHAADMAAVRAELPRSAVIRLVLVTALLVAGLHFGTTRYYPEVAAEVNWPEIIAGLALFLALMAAVIYGLTWLPRLVNINADEILVQQGQGFWRIPLSMLRAVVVERDDFGRRFLRLERTDDAATPPPMPISKRVSDADLAAFFERIGRASLFRAPARP